MSIQEVLNSLPEMSHDELEKIHAMAERLLAKGQATDGNQARTNSALEWIEAHRDEYIGQWVALDGNELLANGEDARTVADVARSKGCERPFLARIKAKDELPFGGW